MILVGVLGAKQGGASVALLVGGAAAKRLDLRSLRLLAQGEMAIQVQNPTLEL